MNYPKVVVIILNWNGKNDTIECLESLHMITYPNYEVLLMDNGSTDGSVECLKKRYFDIEIIENGKNLGFAEGNNAGIRKALEKGADYVLLLNNDTVVDPEFLGELIKVAESTPEVGAVGPKIYYYNDPNRIQFAGAKICWNKGKVTILCENEIDNGQCDRIINVDYIEGCCLLAKCELFEKVGYLSTKYFAYWEETDWCVRANNAGYKILYVPKAKIWHKRFSTSKKISGFYEYYMTRNMIIFMKKNATYKQYFLFLIYFFVFQFWINSGIFILYHRDLKKFTSFFSGVIDGLKIS